MKNTFNVLQCAVRLLALLQVTNAGLFRGFRGIDRNDRMLYIHSERKGQYSGVSYADLEDWRAQATPFAGIGAVADSKIILNDQSGLPEGIRHSVSPGCCLKE